MEQTKCTGCGKPLNDGDWVSKSGLCRACAERALLQGKPTVFNKHWLAILLMCIFGGFLGIHRFAVGKFGSGVVYFFTGGIFGIGVIVDLILIILDRFTEQDGTAIKRIVANELYLEPDEPATESVKANDCEKRDDNEQSSNTTDGEYIDYKFRIAGVTYKNDDGSSRQAYLKEFDQAAEIGDDLELSYDIDDLNGKTRVRISLDGRCIGVIDATDVEEFIKIAERIETAWPTIGDIDSESGNKIYYCYLSVRVKK